ncbi:hypothetical protein [Lysinibacillus pakistanensis]|uniref:hypothetical protein n=2 Tax=Lysinibacillus TaxID=400634 RepID=UPI0028AC7C5E|nr:hypothetical protein [Lysinibacillus pakistanensis]
MKVMYMKNKTILILILLLSLAGMIYFLIEKQAVAGSNTPNVKVEMREELPNGESKVVKPIYEIDEQMQNWLNKKGEELTTNIANQLKVDRKNVKLVLAPIATGENKMLDVSCSVVLLKSKLALGDERIQKVVEGIIDAITNQTDARVTIRTENIVITNSNNEVLH